MNRRFYLPEFLVVVLGSLMGCGVNPLVSDHGNGGPSDPSGADEPGSGETPQASNEAFPDFALPDVNVNSARFREAISPRDYLGQISAWYFGHATWGYCRSQFGFLNQMQAEISSQQARRTIQILGVNGNGLDAANGEMTAGSVLPWLQPGVGDDVWTQWQVQYRDVVILGSGNEHLGTFNLTVHDLSDPANYAALKSQLLEAANE